MRVPTRFYFALLAAICLGSTSLRAESPFSSLGHGLLIESANARSAAMGFTSLTIIDTLSLDRRNISAWSGPATARFGLGGEIIRSVVDDVNGSDLREHGGLAGLAIALPIGKGRFLGLAINPLTRVNYKWVVNGSADQGWSSTIENFSGFGGMSQGLLGVSFLYKESFRFGVGVRAIFGETKRSWQIRFPDAASWETTLRKRDRYRGIGVSVSGHYQYSPRWSLGLVINSPVSIKVQRQSEIIRYDRLRNLSILQTDTTRELRDNWDVPLEISVGLGHRWTQHSLTGEIAWKGWGSVTDPNDPDESFEDALRTSAGWEWAPGYRAFDPFWRVLTYRCGFYYQQHYALSPSENQAYRMALTTGLGVPYHRGRARIDLAVELGMMGNEIDDGAAEKFAVITVGFNHSEHWFKGIKKGR